jgi:hypothetical protein
MGSTFQLQGRWAQQVGARASARGAPTRCSGATSAFTRLLRGLQLLEGVPVARRDAVAHRHALRGALAREQRA